MLDKIKNNLKENKEIVLATILFILCPILSLPIQFILLFKSQKHRRVYTFYISVIIGLIYMNSTPNKYFDLFRYYIKMDVFKACEFNVILEYLRYESEKLMNLIFYLISLTPSKEFIVLFTSVVFYNLYFYMFFDYADKIKLDKKIVNLLIIVFMIVNGISETVTCIRFALASIMFMFAVYIDLVKGKKNWYYKLLYLIPLLLHNSMIAFLAIRVLMVFNKEKINKFILIMMIILSVFPTITLTIMSQMHKIPALQTAIRNLGYITASAELNNFKILMMVLNSIIGILVLEMYRKNPKDKVLQLSMLYLIPAIGLIFGDTITERLFVVIVLIMIFPTMDYYKKIGIKFINKKNAFIYLCFLGCLIFKARNQYILLNNSDGIMPIFENCYKNIISLIMKFIN